jgi:uncharacterized damage-inducible protein DinB
MNNDIPSLATIYDGWALYLNNLTKALTPLTYDQLQMRASADLRPVWVLVAHVIAARVWWFHEVLGEGDPALAPMVDWDDPGQPLRSAPELVAALSSTWELVNGCLRRWTADELAEVVKREVRGKERAYSRQWVVWHVLEHDLHHGGEISFSLGMHGVEGLGL